MALAMAMPARMTPLRPTSRSDERRCDHAGASDAPLPAHLADKMIPTSNRYADLQWERLALTADQVRDYNLTPIIKRDARFKNGGAHEAVETEALSQRVIVETVTNRLDQLLPQPLESVLEREKVERERLRRMLRRAR